MKKISSFYGMFFIIINLIFAEDDSFSRKEFEKSDGSFVVVYEYQGEKYSFAVAFNHDMYDTMERVSVIGSSFEKYFDQKLENENNFVLESQNKEKIDRVCQKNLEEEGNYKTGSDIFERDFSWENKNDIFFDYQLFPSRPSRLCQWFKFLKERYIGQSKKISEFDNLSMFQKQKILFPRKKIFFQNSLKVHKKNIEIEDLDDLQEAYKNHQESYRKYRNSQIGKVLENRQNAFEETFQDKGCKNFEFELQPYTIRFLQTQGVEYENFMDLQGYAIQKQFTKELIQHLNIYAQYGKYCKNKDIEPILKAGLLTAVMAQDYNHKDRFSDAMSSLNCSHALVHYFQGMITSGYSLCEYMAKSLAFATCELTSYSVAVARGVSCGAISSEIFMQLVSIAAECSSWIAPQLTASVYAGIHAISTPLIMGVGYLAASAFITESLYLGYISAVDRELFREHLVDIGKFASQFYKFDQSSYDHVENIAYFVSSSLWPIQREKIFDTFFDMHKIQILLYDKACQKAYKTYKVTSKQIHQALECIKNQELENFFGIVEKIKDTTVFHLYSKDSKFALATEMGVVNFLRDDLRLYKTMQIDKYLIDTGILSLQAMILTQYNKRYHEFLLTDIGFKMAQLANKDYQKKRLIDVAKKYNDLRENKASLEVLDFFLKSNTLSIIPEKLIQEINQLSTNFYSQNKNASSIYVNHIFYPQIKVIIDEFFQKVTRFTVEGFHHDEFGVLHKSGMFIYKDKIYGDSLFGADECYMAYVQFDEDMISEKIKTFFPESWSREKVLQIIDEASKNKDISTLKKINEGRFLVEGCVSSNMIIDMIIDTKNFIVSAYPSLKNFKGQ